MTRCTADTDNSPRLSSSTQLLVPGLRTRADTCRDGSNQTGGDHVDRNGYERRTAKMPITLTSNVAATSWGPNRLDAFAVGANGDLYHKAWANGQWLPSVDKFDILTGPFNSDPAVTWGGGRLDVFVVDGNNFMRHLWGTGNPDGSISWRPFESLGGDCASNPAAAVSPNRIDVLVVGSDKGLYHNGGIGIGGIQPGRPIAWTGFKPVGAMPDCSGSPAAVSIPSFPSSRVDVFVVDTNNTLMHWGGTQQPDGSVTWHGLEALGGPCTGSPAAVSWGPGRLDVFVIDTNNTLLHKAGTVQSDGSISWQASFDNLGRYCIGSPAAVSWGPGRLDAFVIGSDNGLWHKAGTGQPITWDKDFAGLGGFFPYDRPAVASWGPNRFDVFLVEPTQGSPEIDYTMRHNLWTPPNGWWPGGGGFEDLGILNSITIK